MSGVKPDDLYEALVRLHDGLDAERSLFVSQRLILLLCERIGDGDVLLDLIAQARRGVEAGSVGAYPDGMRRVVIPDG